MFSVDMKYTGFYGLSFLEITVALFAVSRCFFAVITAVFSLLSPLFLAVIFGASMPKPKGFHGSGRSSRCFSHGITAITAIGPARPQSGLAQAVPASS
jgi:hypothetical protein